jgi:hypothetical protein
MAIDPNKAAFVKQPYRYSAAEDTSIKTKYPTAREMVLNTNLTGTSAAALATSLFNAFKDAGLAFEIETEGTISLNSFGSSPPRFSCTFPEYGVADRVMTTVAAETDPLANRASATVRG